MPNATTVKGNDDDDDDNDVISTTHHSTHSKFRFTYIVFKSQLTSVADVR